MTRSSQNLMIIAAFALAAPLRGDAAESIDTCSIEFASPAAALAALRENAETTMREENDWIVFSEPTEHVFWSITSRKHPAHPAAVKRCVFERDGVVMMGMDVLCGADRATCDHVVEQFRQLNDSVSTRKQR